MLTSLLVLMVESTAAEPPRSPPPGTTGRVVLVCTPTRSGRVENCKVEQENPAGVGFGELALRASAEFRLKPPAGEKIEGGVLRIPMTLVAPKDGEPKRRGGRARAKVTVVR